MSKHRIKLSRPVVSSRADAERILGEIAADTAALNSIQAELDAEITAVRQRFEGRIDNLAKQLEHKSGLLQQWAEASPEEFGERKSIELLHGRLGFRTGTPKLKTISGWTFDRVLSVVAEAFVRKKQELDKEALLAAHARKQVSDEDLKKIGVRVIQEETFFVEPKLEETVTP